MDVTALVSKASGEEIHQAVLELAASKEASSIDDLGVFLLERDAGTYLKFEIPRWASLALLDKGPDGVNKLAHLLQQAPGAIYPKAILEALWYAAEGSQPNSPFARSAQRELRKPLSRETIDAAKHVVHEVLMDARVNPDVFRVLMNFLYDEVMFRGESREDEGRAIASVYDAFAVGSIRLSLRLIDQLTSLIDQELREEDYQRFLKTNPVFVHPLASRVIPKQKLGIELVTDFVVQTLDGQYILVEIEKPQDRLFTARSDFTSHFTHAYGQVLDFQQWIDKHGEYARSLLPGVSSPKGVLVMGRRSRLRAQQAEKLHRFNVNTVNAEILTFDDLVASAKNLYRSILRTHEESVGSQIT